MVLIPMPGVESVAVGTYVKTGSRYETASINGLSHFLEHMVFKGTKKFPSHEQTSYLEGLGAIQNAWTDVDATAYWCKIVADRWKEGLEMVKELALYPLFPAADLEIERGVIVEEINRKDDRPDELAGEQLQKLVFADNPLAMTVLGDVKVIKTVPREEFVQYHQNQYVSGRLVVVLAGKIGSNKPEISKLIQDYFGGLPKTQGNNFDVLNEQIDNKRYGLYKKKTADQVHFEMGWRGLSVKDERRFPLAILTSYLGEGLSSRLFTELREKRGLCYEVHAGGSNMEDTGLWSVYAGVGQAKFAQAVEAVWGEIKRLQSYSLTEKELVAAKEKIRGKVVFAKENPIHQMEFYARQALDRPEQMMDYDMVIDSLMRVSASDIKDLAGELLLSETMKLSVVGEVKEQEVEKVIELIK